MERQRTVFYLQLFLTVALLTVALFWLPQSVSARLICTDDQTFTTKQCNWNSVICRTYCTNHSVVKFCSAVSCTVEEDVVNDCTGRDCNVPPYGCTPCGCDMTSEYGLSCDEVETATPTPIPPTQPACPPNPCDSWVANGCGGSCYSDERLWTRNCVAGCGHESECRIDATCIGPPSTPTLPPPTPPPGTAIIQGQVSCSVPGSAGGLSGISVYAKDGPGNMTGGPVTTDWQAGNLGRYTMSVTQNAGTNFAVRIGDTVGPGNHGYTAYGEGYCAPNHENCPFNSVSGQTVGNFNFSTDRAASNLAVACGGTSGTFTWNEDPNADRYILRVNKDDCTPAQEAADPTCEWMSDGDYYLWVPVGNCDGASCSVTLGPGDLTNGGLPFQSGDYENFNVQVRDEGVGHCSIYSGPFTCDDPCPAPAFLSGVVMCLGAVFAGIQWTWDDIAAATVYELQVDEAPFDLVPTVDVLLTKGVTPGFACGGGTCTYTTSGLAEDDWDAIVRVFESDGTCLAPSTWRGAAVVPGYCSGNITGRVFSDIDANAGLKNIGATTWRCEDPDYPLGGWLNLPTPVPPLVQPGAGSRVDIGPVSLSGNITVGGTYSVNNVPLAPPGSYTASLTNIDTSQYACSCPADDGFGNCTLGVASKIGSPAEYIDFYVTSLQEDWWQAEGGDIYSEGAIGSTISSSCSGSCEPYLYRSSSEPGVLYSCGGSWDTGSGGVYNDASKVWRAQSCYNIPPSTKYDYAFWRAQFDDSEINTTQYPGCTLGSKPPSAMNDEVFEITCNSDLTLTGANWNIVNKRFIFFINFADPVNQKLILDPGPNNDHANKKSITVRNNSYLMFITNGDIEVADTIERADGVYLTDRTYSTCQNPPCGYDSGTGDKYRLEVEGSVIAWGGDGSLGDAVKLQRDLYTDNFNTPGELFTYRQDVIDLLPREIQTVPLQWEEVPP